MFLDLVLASQAHEVVDELISQTACDACRRITTSTELTKQKMAWRSRLSNALL